MRSKRSQSADKEGASAFVSLVAGGCVGSSSPNPAVLANLVSANVFSVLAGALLSMVDSSIILSSSESSALLLLLCAMVVSPVVRDVSTDILTTIVQTYY